jgi:hypothetical protein
MEDTVVLSLPMYTDGGVHDGRVLLPNGLPQVPSTVTVTLPSLLASILSTVTKVAMLVLLPMVSALPLYRMVLCAQAVSKTLSR